MGDVVDERTFSTLTWNDVHTVVATFQRCLPTHETEPALGPLGAMTTPAGCFEIGTNVAVKIDCLLGGRRKFALVDFRGEADVTAAADDENLSKAKTPL